MIQPALMTVPFRSRVSGLDFSGGMALGQNPSPIRTFVFDRRGSPISDIPVTIFSEDNREIARGVTDGSGSTAVNVEGQKTVTVRADLPEGAAYQTIHVVERGLTSVDFHSRERVSGPAITTVEGLAAGGGVVMLVLGMLVGTGVHRTVGDVFVAVGTSVTAAAAFSAVMRRL